MNEDDKMATRLVAFLLGATLIYLGIYHLEWRRKREGKVIDCALNAVACKVIEHRV